MGMIDRTNMMIKRMNMVIGNESSFRAEKVAVILELKQMSRAGLPPDFP